MYIEGYQGCKECHYFDGENDYCDIEGCDEHAEWEEEYFREPEDY